MSKDYVGSSPTWEPFFGGNLERILAILIVGILIFILLFNGCASYNTMYFKTIEEVGIVFPNFSVDRNVIVRRIDNIEDMNNDYYMWYKVKYKGIVE